MSARDTMWDVYKGNKKKGVQTSGLKTKMRCELGNLRQTSGADG